MTVPVYEEFGGLPEFTLGPQRERPELNEQAEVFDGPWYQQELSQDRPTFWSCSVICDPRQSRAFQNFIEQVVGVNAGFFKKTINTEFGPQQQLVRIVSGIPQAKQIRNVIWRFDFVIMTASINFSGADVPEPESAGFDIVPSAWRYIDMRKVFGINPGSAVAVDSSDDGNVCYFGFDSGRAARSFFGPIGFKQLPQYLGSGATAGSILNDLKCSSSGKIAVAVFSTGHASITKDAGYTWTELPRYLNSGASGTDQIRAVAVSGDGQIIVAVFSNGYASRSTNGGSTWLAMPRGLGSGSTTHTIRTVCISKDGSIIYAAGLGGWVSKSINSGASWTAIPRYFGVAYTGPDIYRIRCSDDGSKVTASIGGQGVFSVDGGVNWVLHSSPAGGKMVTEVSPRGQVSMISSAIAGGQHSKYTSEPTYVGDFVNITPWYLTAEASGAEVNDLKSCSAIWYAAQFNGHAAYCDANSPQPDYDTNFKFTRRLNIVSGPIPNAVGAGQYGTTLLAAGENSRFAYMAYEKNTGASGSSGEGYIFMRSTDAGLTWVSETKNPGSRTLLTDMKASPSGKFVVMAYRTSPGSGSTPTHLIVSQDYGVTFDSVVSASGGNFGGGPIVNRTLKSVSIDDNGFISISFAGDTTPNNTNNIWISKVSMGGDLIPGGSGQRLQDFQMITTPAIQYAIIGGYNWRTRKYKATSLTTFVAVDPLNETPADYELSYSNLWKTGDKTYSATGLYAAGPVLNALSVFKSKDNELDGYDNLGVEGTCVAASCDTIVVFGARNGVSPTWTNKVQVSRNGGVTFENFTIDDNGSPMLHSNLQRQPNSTIAVDTQIVRAVACKNINGNVVFLAVMADGNNNLIRGVR